MDFHSWKLVFIDGPDGGDHRAVGMALVWSGLFSSNTRALSGRCRAQRAPASPLFPGVRPEPVEDVGEVVAGPAFGDLVADDMIDMNSFGVNLEPCRRDVVIGSKVRC